MANGKLVGGCLEQLSRELKDARLKRDLTIDEIGRLVKIRESYIEKLEEGEFDFLPPLYVFSYIRKYTGELGVGNEEMLSQCRMELGTPAAPMLKKNRVQAQPESVDCDLRSVTVPVTGEKRFAARGFLIAGAVIITLLLIAVAFFGRF
jgi:cytoskeletal protein RodZ